MVANLSRLRHNQNDESTLVHGKLLMVELDGYRLEKNLRD